MAPKKSKVSKSSTPSSDLAGRFVSGEAKARYEHCRIHRQPIYERGFEITERQSPVLVGMIRRRGWTNFCAQPKAAVVPVVREFYANARERTNSKAFVRGKLVSFDSETINGLLGTPPVDSATFDSWTANPDFHVVLNHLCYEGAAWKDPLGAFLNFPSRFLKAVPSMWYSFLVARMMPVSYHSDVQRERAAVLFAIMQEIPINIGRLLNAQIHQCIHSSTIGFYFPTIITELCAAAGVFSRDDDEWMQPVHPINETILKGKKEKRQLEFIGPQAVGGSSSAPAPAQPPPQPPKRTVTSKVDELYAWANYQNQCQAVNSEYLMSLDSMMRGMTLHLGMDISAYPPAPPYPPPFQFQYSVPPPPNPEEGVAPPDDDED